MALLLTVATGAWAQDPDPIDLTPSADGTVWTLSTMPEYDVELEVTYYTDAELDQMAADEVIAKITAIGTVTYTPESKALIDAARTAYDALTAAQQALVTNYSTLTDAETTYATAEDTAYTEGVELTKNPDGTWTLAATPAFDVELEVEYETYDVTLAEGSEANGTVVLTVGGEPATNASPGEVVTVSVTPAEGYVVTDISAEAYTTWNAARRSTDPDNIPVYGDIALTPVENVANAWIFTMPAANVEVTVAYAKVHIVHVRAGRFATFYADENIKLATETPQGVTLHTITSVTNTEAVVGSAIEGIVAAGTPLLVYNDTDTDQDVTIIPTAEQPINGLIWDEKFKGTAEDKTFDDAAMQSADYYVLSGGKNFAVVLGAGTLAANQCWLQFDKDQSSNARSFNIVFGETTKINSVESGERRVERWYDLLGRKVNMPTKSGVYIKNDKKVVIK